MPKPIAATPTVGRPRRFDDDTERRMLVEAAIRVMSRGDDASLALGDVLAEAGLSTRAFYRHFESKEALLEALMLREAAAVGRSLARAVAQAADPVAALEAWLERYLDVFYEPRRARRAAQLSSAAFRVSRPSAQMMMEMRRISCRATRRRAPRRTRGRPPLLADAGGRRVQHLQPDHREPGRERRGRLRPDARGAHVQRFAWPTLRLPA